MKIKKLNLSILKEYMIAGELCFIKPMGSKLHRLTYIPERYREDPEKYKELIEVLNTLCVRLHKDIYYFNLEAPEALEEIGTIFVHMDIAPIFMEPDTFGRDDKFEMLPEVYN